VLVLAELAGLAEKDVDERGFAMIDVGDDGDILKLLIHFRFLLLFVLYFSASPRMSIYAMLKKRRFFNRAPTGKATSYTKTASAQHNIADIYGGRATGSKPQKKRQERFFAAKKARRGIAAAPYRKSSKNFPRRRGGSQASTATPRMARARNSGAGVKD
jgi:hypothetical protein